MPGDVDFRDDGHETGGSMRDDCPDHVLRVKAAIVARFAGRRVNIGGWRVARRHAPRPHLGEPRVPANLQTPGLVVGQVPVEDIELVQCHPVDVAHDKFRRLHVPRGLEHDAAPLELGRIDDGEERQLPVGAAGE
jgi:hypothetical protein